jgi:hypothetical protein
MTHGVPAGDILREMDFEDLGVVRVGDALDPEVVPVHVRLDNDDSAGDALSQKRTFLGLPLAPRLVSMTIGDEAVAWSSLAARTGIG